MNGGTADRGAGVSGERRFRRASVPPILRYGLIAVCFLRFAVVVPAAQAATYYISPNSPAGDSNAGTTAGAPFKTFAKAFGAMSGGDELLLLDGVYSETAGTGYISDAGAGSGQPPSGISVSRPTVVRALNEGSVKVIGALNIGFINQKRSFILIQGITFEGQSELYNTSYVTVKNCGFHDLSNSNAGIFGIGTNDHMMGNSYDLIEDVWIWGRNRIIAINYRSDHNVWRRVIIRGDGCNAAGCTNPGSPNYGMGVYDSSYISLQNVMVLDRILDGGSPYGDFITAQHTPGFPFGRNEWLGTLSLKAPDVGYFFELDEANLLPVHKLKDCIAWDPAEDGISINQGTAEIENCTFKVNNSQAGGMSAVPGDTLVFTQGPGYVRNVIVMGQAKNAIYSAYPISYADASGTWLDPYGLQTCSIGCRTTNPLADGNPPSIKYIPRIEAGSALKGSGFGGADYGANVVNRYGADGSRWGEANFNTLSSVSLWPYPNEGRLKKEMCTDTGVTRGFCSAQTLTRYIWEAAGNPCPPDICSGNPPPPPAAPVITSALTASGTVGSAFSYQITASNSPTSFNATGLPAGLSVNTSNGLISGTPAAGGTSSVALSAGNSGGTGTAILTLTINIPVPPTVSIVPLSTTTVSGTVTLTASASSNLGIASVQFQLDGSNLGSPITSPPFTLSWNTLQAGAGTHSLTAIATDIAGNKVTSAPITVTVVKTADATPGLRNAIVYPNPAVKTDPVIRAFLGAVDSVEITIFDASGRVAHSSTLAGAPTGILNGQYYYDYKWTGSKASGTYFAVIHGKAADGTIIRARVRFAVVN